ncbi:uncharacterized protein HD556DRAFT_1305027 [Suillus plorans]|uniref:Uncharacterized protein n=1 Tax=Suillus plorans TaxID=116603 RepID=A0A9P7DPX1_9AGAM|nr:uncharacterized protein HD556DRAFT_1305027 [Suillus plorans]KAG1800238.1 hypothetical protein HD556DRAFT_1305027 [Suillus plorans]
MSLMQSLCKTAWMVGYPSSFDALVVKRPQISHLNKFLSTSISHPRIGGDVAVLVQAFAQEFAVPHLQRFAAHCIVENMKPSRNSHISVTGPQHLPAPMVATRTHIQCSAQAPKVFSTSMQSSLDSSSSVAIHHGGELAAGLVKKTTPLTPHSEIRQHHPANMFAKSSPLVATHTQSQVASDPTTFGMLLISIGPHTDATLDWLNLGDKNVLKLRTLIGTVHSSRWEAILRSPAWDLNALLADLQVGIWSINPEVAASLKHRSSWLTSIFKLLGILVLLCALYLFANGYPVLLFSETQFKHEIVLSKEACTALRLDRCAKSLRFKNTLDNAWKQLDNTMKNITTSHHKSCGPIQSKCLKLNLWNTFCWKKNKDKENHSLGKAALQSLIHDNKDEYFALSKGEQDKLLTEFIEFKETKTTGVHTSTKSKINDITHTLKVVEDESTLSYRCRDYSLHHRGSTDLPLRGIAFATKGIKNFMGTIMEVDNQDLVSKMEGFAVQGMKEEITGDDHAKMQWVYYFGNVIQCYQVIMEGWPEKIPFINLSQKSLSNEEFEELHKEHEEKLESSELADHCCQPQSDKGKKHAEVWKSTAQRKQFKSAETISDDNSDAEGDEVIHKSAAPSDEAICESAPPSVVATASAFLDTTSPQPLDSNFSASGSFDQYINLNTLDCNAMLANLERLFGPTPSTLLE